MLVSVYTGCPFGGYKKLGRPLRHFIVSIIGFKRITFRNIFLRALRAILGNIYPTSISCCMLLEGRRSSGLAVEALSTGIMAPGFVGLRTPSLKPLRPYTPKPLNP